MTTDPDGSWMGSIEPGGSEIFVGVDVAGCWTGRIDYWESIGFRRRDISERISKQTEIGTRQPRIEITNKRENGKHSMDTQFPK